MNLTSDAGWTKYSSTKCIFSDELVTHTQKKLPQMQYEDPPKPHAEKFNEY